MADITIKQEEGKWLQFTVTRNDAIIDLSSATLKLGVKAAYTDTTYLIEKLDGDFDKSQASVGIVRVNLSVTDTDLEVGNYLMELKIIITADIDVDKSVTYNLRIDSAVIHD